jgi:peroxiredoxin
MYYTKNLFLNQQIIPTPIPIKHKFIFYILLNNIADNLNQNIMAIAVGSKAPSFKLFNTDRKEISSGDFTGKILVINFFPAAFTGVCTEQLCTSRDELGFYNDIGAAVVGISVDMPFSLKVFKEQNHITYDLLSDFNKLSIHEYEMYHCNFACGIKGVAKRGVVVVDTNGNVAYAEETANPGTQVNFAMLKEALKKLK